MVETADLLAKILYILAGTLWAIELFPQLVKTYRRKIVKDISIFYPLICFISFLCFFTATYLSKNWVLLYSYIVPFICNTIFLIMVLIYREKNEVREVTDLMKKGRLSAYGMKDKKTGLNIYRDVKTGKIYLSDIKWRLK